MSVDIATACNLINHLVNDKTNVEALFVRVPSGNSFVVEDATAGYKPFTLASAEVNHTISPRGGNSIVMPDPLVLSFQLPPTISFAFVLLQYATQTYSEPRTTYERVVTNNNAVIGMSVFRNATNGITNNLLAFHTPGNATSDTPVTIEFQHYNDQVYNRLEAAIFAVDMPLFK